MNAVHSEAKSNDLALTPGMYMSSHTKLPWMQRLEEHVSWPVLAKVPETLIVFIPLSNFTVRALLGLEKGHVIGSEVMTSDLVPMKIGVVKVAWGEFEMVEQALALRVTKLA